MQVLAIDSAASACSACVWRDGHILAVAAERMERGQDQRLIPLILEVMAKASCGFDQVDRIAVTRGPGSFTGLRIGLAAARGIGLATGKPVIGIDRFAIYRRQFPATFSQSLSPASRPPPYPSPPGGGEHSVPGLTDSPADLLIVLQSKRAELFCRYYPVAAPPHEPVMMTTAEIDRFRQQHPNLRIADDVDDWPEAKALLPSQKEVEICAQLAARADAGDLAFLPRPLYLRPPDVTVKPTATGSA